MSLEEILISENILDSIQINLNYIIKLIPEVKDMFGFDHKHPHHHLDVWNHTLYALSLSENDFEIRLVLLLHDIGKPHSYQEGEVRHFNNHADKSCEIANNILKRLGYNSDFINEICFLIKYHDTQITLENIKTNYCLYEKLYKIQYCDAYAHNPLKMEKREKYLNDIKKMLIDNNPKKLKKNFCNISI